MVRTAFVLTVGTAALAFNAIPASAVTIIEARCTSVLEADDGCAFTGNDNDVPLIESTYNASGKAGAPISLNLIGKIDEPDTMGPFGSITVAPDGKSGTWSLPGYIVDFISVKAANEFLLVKLTNPGSTGTWTTLGLLTGGGTQPDWSHIQFYGGVIPEPATWALLIAGFGLVGASLRRRKGTTHVAA